MASVDDVVEKTTESSTEDNPSSVTAATSTAPSTAKQGTSVDDVVEKTTERSTENSTSSVTAATSTAASAVKQGTTPEVISLIDSDDNCSRVSRTRIRRHRPPPLDCEVVLVAHVVESPRSKRRRPVIDLGASESDSDIEILHATINAGKNPLQSIAVAPADTEPSVAHGDDIAAVTTATGVRPNVDYPHLRSNCGMHPFGTCPVQNLLSCDRCFCYVCDTPAESCSSWFFHSSADEKKLCWQEIRHYVHRIKAGKSTPTPTKAFAIAGAEGATLCLGQEAPTDEE